MLDAKCSQRRLVKPAQNQLLLAGIMIDIAHCENTGHAGLNFSVSTRIARLSRSSPHSAIGPSFGCKAKESEHVLCTQLVLRTIVPVMTIP